MAKRCDPYRRVDRGRDLTALDELEPRVVEPAGWGGVDHAPAAERRPLAQDDAVAAGCDRRRREPELRVALPGANDPRVELGGAVVDVEALPVGNRLELLEHDVEPVA